MNVDKIMKKYLYEDDIAYAEAPKDAGDIGSKEFDLLYEVLNAEKMTVNHYLSLLAQSKDERVRKIISDITDEERVHMYEIQATIDALQSNHAKKLKAGAEKEVQELIGK